MYRVALAKDRTMAIPQVTDRTPEGIQEWKTHIRAFDAARLELGIKTGQELQEENTAVRVPPGGYRIVRHERYA